METNIVSQTSGIDEKSILSNKIDKIIAILYDKKTDLEKINQKIENEINQVLSSSHFNNDNKAYFLENIGDLMFGIGNFDNGMLLLEEASKIINNPEKTIDLYRKKIDFFLAYSDYLDSKNDIFDNLKKETLEKISIITEKIVLGELEFNLGLLEEQKGNKKEALEYFRKGRIKGYDFAIYKYTESLENEFLEDFNKLQTQQEKQKYLDENLEIFEEKYYYFIDNIVLENGEVLVGKKDLYGNIGNFYEQIGLYKEALSNYKDGIIGNKNGYVYYNNIAKIYFDNKINLKVFSKTNLEIALDNYELFLRFSYMANDIENYLIALEGIGDVFVKLKDDINAQNYYFQAMYQLKNTDNKDDKKRISYKLLDIVKDEKIIKNILTSLLSYDYKELLGVGYYYEKTGNILYAFFNYIRAYNIETDDQKFLQDRIDYLIMFLETSLKDKIKDDNNNFFRDIGIENENIDFEESDEIEENIEITKEILQEEFKISNLVIDKIINKLDNNKILEFDDISALFEMVLDSDYFDKKIFSEIDFFIDSYNKNILHFDIYLYTIIDYFKRDNNKNSNKNEIDIILEKIKKNEQLLDEDIEKIKIFVNFFENIFYQNEEKEYEF